MKGILYVVMIIILAITVFADCDYGTIYTSKIDCEKSGGMDTQFIVGDIVYVKGYGFGSNCSLSFYVESQCVPKQIKSIGWVTTGTYGSFCTQINTIDVGECGTYEVVTEHQHHSYTVTKQNTIPEFTSVGIMLAMAGGVGFYIIRRRVK
jgi:hypothetical protein